VTFAAALCVLIGHDYRSWSSVSVQVKDVGREADLPVYVSEARCSRCERTEVTFTPEDYRTWVAVLSAIPEYRLGDRSPVPRAQSAGPTFSHGSTP